MPFRAILDSLVHTHPGEVRGAIFCDHEGERVDASCGDLTPFDLDIAGASFAATAETMIEGQRMRVVLGTDIYWIIVVDLGYYLVVCCRGGREFACKTVFTSIASALSAYM